MARKPRVLLTFFEGLLETVIDSQVLGHVRLLQTAGIAEFEIWTLPWEPQVRALSLARQAEAEARADCRIRILAGIRPGRPCSVADNGAILIGEAERQNAHFDILHARTDYCTLASTPLAKAMGASLLFDCRGDAAAELEYRPDLRHGARRLLKPLLHRLLMRRLHAAARSCDRGLFVSHPLHQLVSTDLGSKPYAVIPCCASEKEFFFDPGLRRRSRATLGYADDDIVYIYSGGLQAYQRFVDTVAAFQRLREIEVRARLLVATPQADAARQQLAGLPADSWQVVSARLEEVNGLLNAADAAFLLRHADATNRVASPTKFAEYCLAGLPVIMTAAISDSHDIARRNGNLMPFDDRTLAVSALPLLDRKAMAQRYADILGKHAFLDTYRRIYAID